MNFVLLAGFFCIGATVHIDDRFFVSRMRDFLFLKVVLIGHINSFNIGGLNIDGHMDGSNADFALRMDWSHADYAPHMERTHSFRYKIIAKI